MLWITTTQRIWLPWKWGVPTHGRSLVISQMTRCLDYRKNWSSGKGNWKRKLLRSLSTTEVYDSLTPYPKWWGLGGQGQEGLAVELDTREQFTLYVVKNRDYSMCIPVIYLVLPYLVNFCEEQQCFLPKVSRVVWPSLISINQYRENIRKLLE